MTGFRVGDVPSHVVIEERLALLAVVSSRVVLAIIADTAGDPAGSLVDGLIEVTRRGVIVTVTLATGVGLFADRGLPRTVVVEVLTILAIESFGEVSALAPSMDHFFFVGDTRQFEARGRVAVTRARAANDHVLDSVVILLAYLGAIVEKIVSQGVQPLEMYTNIRHLHQILYLLRVRIVDDRLEIRGQNPEDYFTVRRRGDVRVTRLADHIRQFPRLMRRHSGKRLLAIVSEVTIDLPRFAEVVGTLDQHSGRTEGPESYYQVGEVELRLEVERYRHVLHSVLRLPPGVLCRSGTK